MILTSHLGCYGNGKGGVHMGFRSDFAAEILAASSILLSLGPKVYTKRYQEAWAAGDIAES